MLSVRANVVAGSVNEANRTVDLCFATETPVRQRSWDGIYYEVLSFDPSHVRMERMNAGAPLLDNHNRWGSVLNSLGVVEKAWIKERAGYCTIRFSKREGPDQVFQDVKDGITKAVSVGYNVYAYEELVREGEPPIYTAIDWEPAEVSMTQIPADINAGVRSEGGDAQPPFQVINIVSSNFQTRGMDPEEVTTPAGGTPTPEATRTDPAPPAAPAPAAPAAPDSGARAADATIAERNRISEIQTACRAAGMEDSFTQGLVANGTSIDSARAAIIQQLAQRQAPPQQSHPRMHGEDETDNRRRFMANAILCRADSGATLEEGARQYRHMDLMDMARHVLEGAGIRTAGKSKLEIAQLALTTRALHTTSDFPIILGAVVNKSLRAAYDLAPRTFTQFCRKVTVNDFKKRTVVQLSQLVKGFKEVVEGGEYKRDTFSEGKEEYAVKKYGEIVGITWESLINDDLDAFSRIPRALANQAAQLQSDLVYSILIDNPTMGDGTALFHSSHGNLASPGAAISTTSLGAARAAMRKQKDKNAKDYINVSARHIIVGPDKETEAEQVLSPNATIYPATDSATNVFRGKLNIITEPRITGNKWFLSADPATIDTIEYAFLEGEGELFTQQREGFEVDGVEIKARMVFAAKAIDWKGLYRNPGN